ncbi:MAG: ThiF family adenylyltransferase [Mailhella sp.]|nr:ThiF family adenylyltransferase [Mailhella sp.]
MPESPKTSSAPLDADTLRRFLSQYEGSCEGAFVRISGVKKLAQEFGLSEREAMCALLDAGFWPERFRRSCSVLTAEELKRLLRAKVFLAGCGGLGGHVAALLARSGVGAFVLCDPDVFEESNLNRQMFCTESTLGRSKALVCRRGLLDMASHLDVEAHVMAVDEENLPGLMRGCSAVVDGLDSILRKLMLEAGAAKAGLPFVHGSVNREEGFAFIEEAGERRLANMWPDAEKKAETGDKSFTDAPDTVVASAAGVACLMASLLVKALAKGEVSSSALLHLDCSVPELERFGF